MSADFNDSQGNFLDGKLCPAERPVLPRRPREAHKYRFGRVFILAGSVGYTGAAALCAGAALRSGAGLVTLAVPPETWPVLAVKCPAEVMVWPLSDRYEEVLKKAAPCDVAVIGPGLGQSEGTEKLVLSLLRDLECPVVLDADGINIAAKHIDVLDKRRSPTVLTPHEGEFARLSGCTTPVENRAEAARAFACGHGCVLVLKGYRTVTAFPDGRCVVNTTGNPGMARGGSGDALAGLTGALLGQLKTQEAVAAAVWLHGRAGDLAAEEKGEYGMTVTDLIQYIPYAMKEITEVE